MPWWWFYVKIETFNVDKEFNLLDISFLNIRTVTYIHTCIYIWRECIYIYACYMGYRYYHEIYIFIYCHSRTVFHKYIYIYIYIIFLSLILSTILIMLLHLVVGRVFTNDLGDRGSIPKTQKTTWCLFAEHSTL